MQSSFDEVRVDTKAYNGRDLEAKKQLTVISDVYRCTAFSELALESHPH